MVQDGNIRFLNYSQNLFMACPSFIVPISNKINWSLAPAAMAVTSLLAIKPLIANDLIDTDHIIVDSKIGSSGAGSKANASTHHAMRYGVIRPYKPVKHRHTGEIEQELGLVAKRAIRIGMTPHAVNVVPRDFDH